jgi:hypothetical protein
MAMLTRTATFTASAGPVQISFPTPAANFGIGPGAPTITDAPTVGASCWCDTPVNSSGTTTVNVYASDVITGYVDVTIFDKA